MGFIARDSFLNDLLDCPFIRLYNSSPKRTLSSVFVVITDTTASHRIHRYIKQSGTAGHREISTERSETERETASRERPRERSERERERDGECHSRARMMRERDREREGQREREGEREREGGTEREGQKEREV